MPNWKSLFRLHTGFPLNNTFWELSPKLTADVLILKWLNVIFYLMHHCLAIWGPRCWWCEWLVEFLKHLTPKWPDELKSSLTRFCFTTRSTENISALFPSLQTALAINRFLRLGFGRVSQKAVYRLYITLLSCSLPTPLPVYDKWEYTTCLEGYHWEGFWKGSDTVLNVSTSTVGCDLALGGMYGDYILFPSAFLQIYWAQQFLLWAPWRPYILRGAHI